MPGEHVLDVPATLASRVRVLGTGKSGQERFQRRPVGGHRRPAIPRVSHRFQPADHADVLRLLAKRNQLTSGTLWTKLVCRLHVQIASLAAGGIAKELNASDADGLLGVSRTRPLQLKYDPSLVGPGAAGGCPPSRCPAEGVPQADQVGGPSVGDLAAHRRRLWDRSGAGLLTDRLHRRRHPASSQSGPVRCLQRHRTGRGLLGGRVTHRLSRGVIGNSITPLHMVAICQIRQTQSEGRAYFGKKPG